MKVKICGITNVETALAAAAAGADYLGLVFAPSRRRVSTAAAREIITGTKGQPKAPRMVGVFVNQSTAEVNATAAECGLDLVQLSGDEDWDFCRQVHRPVIKALHISPESTPAGILGEIARGQKRAGTERLICLLDTAIPGQYGGTGQTFNHRLARAVAARFPVIIAGGLNPETVEQVVREVRPWGIDVSSGVETAGKKDSGKIGDFIRRAKTAGE